MISVCMATYNGEKYIKEQLDSILSQLESDDELLISDDGSTDNTISIIQSYNDSRIHILNHVPNPSYSGHEKVSSNFENALKNAHGDYIFLSDQDDIWCKDKVKKCVEKLQNNDFVYHNAEYFYDDGRQNKVRFSANPFPRNWFINLKQMSLSGCCFAFNRKCLGLSLPFPEKLIGQDYWISSIALKYCKLCYIDECLILHRRYNESVSSNKKNSLIFKINYRLKLLLQLICHFYSLRKRGVL